jgi:hypothetical protein
VISLIRSFRLFSLVAAFAGGAASSSRADSVTFRQDVMALVSKAGCNLGGCHGNATGKGGLKLSLRGQDPDLDWIALVREQAGRRVDVIEPEKSLLLLKATAALGHEGGQRFKPGSEEYDMFLRWLQDGAPDSGVNGPQVTRLEVTGAPQVVVEPQREFRVQVRAVYSDGSHRDVSKLAVYEPNNTLTKATHDGLISRERAGESTVLVRYLNQQVPVTVNWVLSRPGWEWKDVPANNFIDETVFQKLRTVRIQPSELCSDEVFVRRANLDLLGLIPSEEAARAFVQNTAPDKRARLIDELLGRQEFTDFWTLKWADLLKIEERLLDKPGMEVFHRWIRESIAADKPMDQFARELIAARGDTFENAPANWWRANRDPITRAENTARVFLGVQLNCAQCHNHPFERWTQDDYYSWAALFTRLDYRVGEDKRTDKNDKSEFRGDQTVVIKASGGITNPRTGEKALARFLGGPAPAVTSDQDELQALSDWLSRSPMFAKMQVNRVWFHLFGRGLVDPVDDFRVSNPPSHPEVLEQLARDFESHGYSLRHVIRTIMNSRVYQLSSVPNETNAGDELFHSHALVRRLTAEQLADSLAAATGAPLQIEGVPEGTRLAQVVEGRKYYKPLKTDLDRFGAAFGKPPRLIASECERSNELAMPQAFQLISGPLIQELLTRKDNRIDQLLSSGKHELDIVDDLFWTALSREPSTRELDRFASRLMNTSDRRKTTEDLFWALLNSKEFLFQR